MCKRRRIIQGRDFYENGVLFMYTLEGVSSVANFITAYEESQ